ncbi:bifunctional 2-polyprenyl-6-hydroxyphenol methylase/3-demethylubiquinol 3-O-methyltransferase UbiG [Roseovarius sp. M141]|uniref:class I SAM-dependent methyltransferase n=1 Tax=Roseovarius sp. M141 TaxID=2583806 RepID=UPI0020CECEDD|nr:methyltransferase domain-containing protein [Roseovarius sp. M141]MCQ0091075.1 class I SAM-dependent methyltransferase [Roseovarius sp. M141]
MTKSITSYTTEYLDDFGFEAEMVRYRRQLVLERLAHHSPQTVIELGCGADLQAKGYWDAGGRWSDWTIIEPSQFFSDHARASPLPGLRVIQGFFENVTEQVPNAADLMLCSGLLHEVPDSDQLISAMRQRMGPETVLHINVPNAQSIHRQLAQAMGLIDDVKAISPRNASLQQPRVYDLPDLVAQLEDHGLSVTATGGHLVKPFTHQQMEPLVSDLGREVMNGLYELGKRLPNLASEVFVEARIA